MKVEVTEPCAGTSFAYRKGEILSSDTTPEARLKDLVRGGHAIDITPDKGEVIERKVRTGIEKR